MYVIRIVIVKVDVKQNRRAARRAAPDPRHPDPSASHSGLSVAPGRASPDRGAGTNAAPAETEGRYNARELSVLLVRLAMRGAEEGDLRLESRHVAQVGARSQRRPRGRADERVLLLVVHRHRFGMIGVTAPSRVVVG